MSENHYNKTERIFFISRAVGQYFALKRYAVCRECGLPWPPGETSAQITNGRLILIGAINSILLLIWKRLYALPVATMFKKPESES